MKQKLHYFSLLFVFWVGMGYSPAIWAQKMDWQAIKNAEPSLSELVGACLDGFDLEPENSGSWSGQQKKSALLPQLSLGYDRQLKTGESISITDNISTSSGVITIGPEDNNFDFDQDNGHVFRVRAQWDLSDLVFHSQKLNLVRERASLLKLRRTLEDEIYALYEKRYALLHLYFEQKKHSFSKAKETYRKFELLTDRLNQISHQKFENQFWREKS